MAARQIPFCPRGVVHYRQRVVLDQRTYSIELHHNGVDGHWYFDLFDAADRAVRLGVRILDRIPLLGSYPSPSRPPGDIVPLLAADGSWQLIYLDVAELSQ